MSCFVGEELLVQKKVDKYGIESTFTWGGCVTQPFYVDEDIIYACGEHEIPWNGACLVDSLRLFAKTGMLIVDESSCEDYNNGTWTSPSNSREACESDVVSPFNGQGCYELNPNKYLGMFGNHLWSPKTEEECNQTAFGVWKTKNTWVQARNTTKSWR